MAENDNVKQEGRIIYVEPNDVFDKDNDISGLGLSLTPRYEDMCISFNLIIEQFQRFKSSGTNAYSEISDEGKKKEMIIQWGLSGKDLVKKRTSVLQGNRGEFTVDEHDNYEYVNPDYNYLTTYYTDINHSTYKEKTEIEGLGVESVQISYESWYTPTIVIKFIDVRGSALFGREEAIHINEKLTVENVFGAFFTMPYPLFRLQVKGFFGKPVTYQLTCSNFKGEYNSQTGNFEATATFIGYSWSLLTDIPFLYLVAAPNATYLGADYWERHKDDPEWGLWDDEGTNVSPPKLMDMFKKIEQADEAFDNEFAAATKEENEEIQKINGEKQLLNEINSRCGVFRKQLGKLCDQQYINTHDINEKKDQFILFSSNNEIKLKSGHEVSTAFDKLCESVKNYSETYPDGTIKSDNVPNGWSNMPTTLSFADTFVIKMKENSNIIQSISLKDYTQITEENFKKLKLNGGRDELTRMSINMLMNGMLNETKNSNFKQYAYLIDFGNLISLVEDRLNELIDNERAIDQTIDNKINYEVTKILGFKPYIGNIFKILFCHLETFCHIMFDSAAIIYEQMKNNLRNANYLGINIDNTDMVPRVSEDVVPWPAVYDQGKLEQNPGYVSEMSNVYAWVGDFSHKFEEEKVVYAIQEGIQNVIESMAGNRSKRLEIPYFPIMPCDYINGGSPFANSLNGNISDVTGSLSMRAAAIFGVMCGNSCTEDIATLFGKMDAYNMYSSIGNVAYLKERFEERSVGEMMQICHCEEEGDKWAFNEREGSDKKWHSFETVKAIDASYNDNGRHPMFKKYGSHDFFVHWYDRQWLGFVPATLTSFENYKRQSFDYENGKNGIHFNPLFRVRNETIEAENWLHTCDSSKIEGIYEAVPRSQGKEGENLRNYTNKNMFSIITDSDSISRIENKKQQLKTGNCQIYDYKVPDNFDNYIKNFMLVGVENTVKYMEGCLMFSGSTTKLGIDSSKLIDVKSKTTDFTYDGWDTVVGKKTIDNKEDGKRNLVYVNADGSFTLDGENINYEQLVVQMLRVAGGDGNVGCNIFGHPFYYLQNTITDDKIRNRVKALLFLHTFRYNTKKMHMVSPSKKIGGLESVPKALLLLYGGLLWRQRQGKDPIVFNNEYKDCGINKTFFVSGSKTNYFFIMKKNVNKTYCSINDIFGSDTVDYNIENQLIELFENFVDDKFVSITNKYEILNGKIVKKDGKENKQTSLCNYSQIVNLINTLYALTLTYTASNATVGVVSSVGKFNDAFAGFTNWSNYSAINVDLSYTSDNQYGLRMMFNENDKGIQDTLKDLYYGSYIISDMCYRKQGKEEGAADFSSYKDHIYVSEKFLEAYFNGFLTGIKAIIDSTNTTTNSEGEINISEDTIVNRDLSISIYYYLKNLWDKWLVISPTDAFDIKNFFEMNFIFIDSFYKNIYHKLAINCNVLLELWHTNSDETSLFNFISKTLTDHHCMFMPVPDYVGFNGNTQKQDIEMMEDLFRPLPFSAMEAPTNSNKFVVIYTQEYSKSPTEDNGFKQDSYDLWSYSVDGTRKPTKDNLLLFGTTIDPDFDRERGTATREGYNVPSFGVAVGRQNNHLFKNLKCTMDNPVMTEQAIKTQAQIARMGSGGGKKVCFVGQDTFNVFTNYSYSITVDMMGNAQICPLMYFQLLNVPMWRGTYMIYKVNHNMTPGNMTTTITGMKMSKYAKPFNEYFFMRAKKEKEEKGGKNGYNSDCDGDNNNSPSYEAASIGAGTGVMPPPLKNTDGLYFSYNKTNAQRAEIAKDVLGIDKSDFNKPKSLIGPNEGERFRHVIEDVTITLPSGKQQTIKLNKYAIPSFLKIVKEINGLGFFDYKVTSHYRPNNSLYSKLEKDRGVSRHCWGIAVDINSDCSSKANISGNPWFYVGKGSIGKPALSYTQGEPAEGQKAPWTCKKFTTAPYKRSRCTWHWGHPVVQIFLKHGWGWGGAYGDVMHFSMDDGH